jgi:hypothetical protein
MINVSPASYISLFSDGLYLVAHVGAVDVTSIDAATGELVSTPRTGFIRACRAPAGSNARSRGAISAFATVRYDGPSCVAVAIHGAIGKLRGKRTGPSARRVTRGAFQEQARCPILYARI